MKANLYEGNGTFRIHDVDIKHPGPHEVRVKIAYCGICGTDLHIYDGGLDYRIKHLPQAVGHECSGVVEEVGSDVTDWKIGDRVVIRPLDYCGTCVACRAGHSHVCANLKFMGIESEGAFQNYWTVHERTLHHLPDSISLKHGALVEPLAVCCHAVSRGELKAGEYAVVIGGGPIGLLTALVARYRGARVVVSEVNPVRLSKVKEMGFDTVNPKEVDLVKYVYEATNGDGADIVFEVSGSQAGLDTMVNLPHPRGRIVLVASYPHPMQVFLRELFMKEVNLITTRVYEAKDYEDALDMMTKNTFDPDALISRIYPLSQVQQGMELCASGVGDVVKVLIDCQKTE